MMNDEFGSFMGGYNDLSQFFNQGAVNPAFQGQQQQMNQPFDMGIGNPYGSGAQGHKMFDMGDGAYMQNPFYGRSLQGQQGGGGTPGGNPVGSQGLGGGRPGMDAIQGYAQGFGGGQQGGFNSLAQYGQNFMNRGR